MRASLRGKAKKSRSQMLYPARGTYVLLDKGERLLTWSCWLRVQFLSATQPHIGSSTFKVGFIEKMQLLKLEIN